MKTITIKALKLPNRVHLEWSAETKFVTENWLVALASPGTMVTHHTKGIEFPLGHNSLSIFSSKHYFNVMIDFSPAGEFQRIYSNISMPAKWNVGSLVEWIDLELDVIVTKEDGAVLVDQDEFEENVKNGILTPEIANIARSVSDDVIALARSGKFPFFQTTLEETIELIRSTQIDKF